MILCWMFYVKNLELRDNREYREESKHMEYCLFRHGQTNWNVNGIIKSHMDDSGTYFTEAGQEQIKYITKLLKNTGIQAVFASDLYRTTETANYINAYLKVPVFFSERLRGMDMGAFLGKPIEKCFYLIFFSKKTGKMFVVQKKALPLHPHKGKTMHLDWGMV